MRQTATAQRVAPMWESTTLLPSQMSTNQDRMHRPELHLVSAIFEDALHCVVGNVGAGRGRKRRDFLDACDWFWSDEDNWPFAFVNICDLLAIDRAAVRETLRAYIVAQHDLLGLPVGYRARHWGRRMLRQGPYDGQLSPRERLEITRWDEV